MSDSKFILNKWPHHQLTLRAYQRAAGQVAKLLAYSTLLITDSCSSLQSIKFAELLTQHFADRNTAMQIKNHIKFLPHVKKYFDTNTTFIECCLVPTMPRKWCESLSAYLGKIVCCMIWTLSSVQHMYCLLHSSWICAVSLHHRWVSTHWMHSRNPILKRSSHRVKSLYH